MGSSSEGRAKTALTEAEIINNNMRDRIKLLPFLLTFILGFMAVPGGGETLVGGLTYPTTVTVSSTGGAADYQPESLGVYRISTTLTWKGLPVWWHIGRSDRYLFYNDNNWVISDEVTNDLASIRSEETPLRFEADWQYWDGYDWYNDNTLRVTEGEPTYPGTLTLSSTGGAADSHTESLGVYTITPYTWSGRPVWTNIDRDDSFLFYNGDWSRWVESGEVSNDWAYIQSKKTGLIYPPLTGWEYYGRSDDWYDDNTLRVRGS